MWWPEACSNLLAGKALRVEVNCGLRDWPSPLKRSLGDFGRLILTPSYRREGSSKVLEFLKACHCFASPLSPRQRGKKANISGSGSESSVAG